MTVQCFAHNTLDKFFLFIILFIYVFAFYIGPISTSILISVPLYVFACFNRPYFKCVIFVIKTRLIRRLIKLWMIILFLGMLFPIIYLTFDYSFVKVFLMQFVHYIAAIPVLGLLRYKKYHIEDVEFQFINIFIIQTIIQFVVISIPGLRESMFAFNHFNPDSVIGIGNNFRGAALSAATTYHLTLAYGIAFIIYLKYWLSYKISLVTILIGVAIFAGIFCAGRSGFVGCAIGLIGYIIMTIKQRKMIRSFLKIVFYSFSICVLLLFLLSVTVPSFYDFLQEYVFPYAFEALYSKSNSGTIETQSTNELIKMWNNDFDILEIFVGSGHFTNSDDTYYMYVDPGILRHTLFFGIIGYIVLIYYQYCAIPFLSFKSMAKQYCMLIYIFICIMDLKGLTIGGNKFMIFIPLLLSFTYLYLKSNRNSEVNPFYNCIPA